VSVLANNDRQINWTPGNVLRCPVACVHNLRGTHSASLTSTTGIRHPDAFD